MSTPLPPSTPAGNGTDSFRPREIIYLDRGRLFSYASQLHDGLTQIRRILTAVESGEILTTDELETEKATDTATEGEAGIEAAIKASGKRSKTSTLRQMKKSGGDSKGTFSSDIFTEEKTELDNLFLLVESELAERQLLKDYNGINTGGLLRVSGVAKLTDNLLMRSIMSNIDAIASLPGVDNPEVFQMAAIGGANLASIIEMAVPSEFNIYINSHDSMIMAPLDGNHLAISKAQLRAAYTLGPIDLTMICFQPKISDDDFVTPGINGNFNFSAIFEEFVGEVDSTVVPIAIYATL